MEIKQLTYTSVGKEGRKIERYSGDISTYEIAAFKNISDSFSITKNKYVAFDYIDGNICILSKTVPFGMDSENRERNYTHGYLFSGSDCDEVMKIYPYLLGINYFAETMEDNLVDVNEVTSKFIDKAEFLDISVFLEGLFEALFAKKTLEILTDEPDQEHFIKKIMNTVYDYIPVSLRKFITFSSHVTNIRRTLEITKEFSVNAVYTYDFISGKANGLSGKYKMLSHRLVSDKMFAEEFEKNINMYCSSKLPDAALIIDVIENIEMAEKKKQEINTSNVVEKIIEVVNRNKYNADADYFIKLLDIIIKEKIKLSDYLEEDLCNIHSKTNSSELKESIADCIVAKRSKGDKSDFEFVFLLCKTNLDLCISVMKKLAEINNINFLKSCVKHINANPDFGNFIVEICGEKCADSVAKMYIETLMLNENRKELFNIIIKNRIHSYVVKQMLLYGDADIIWDYECTVYSSLENIMACDTIDRNLLDQCEDILHREISNPKRDGQKFIETVYLKLGKNIFSVFENKLIKNGNGNILVGFYSDFIAANCRVCSDFNNLKEKMKSLGLSTAEFIQKNIDRYSEFCIKETLAENLTVNMAVKRIDAFAEGMTISSDVVDKIKEEFWICFKWENFSFSFADARVMKLQGNPKSIIANNLLNLYDYIRGVSSSIDEDELKSCKDALCYENSNLTLKERDTIITKLRFEVNENVKCNTEIKLLVNYSNKNKSLNIKKADFTAEELSEYLTWCKTHSSCMLRVDGVVESLLQYAEKKYREENIANFNILALEFKKYKENFSNNEVLKDKKNVPIYEVVSKFLPSVILIIFLMATIFCGKLLNNFIIRGLLCGIMYILGLSFMSFMYIVKKKEKSIPFLAELLVLIINYIVVIMYIF